MGQSPDYVDKEERPDATIENVPDDVIEGALSIATCYRECPECELQQFLNVVPGHNSTDTCRDCGAEFNMVG